MRHSRGLVQSHRLTRSLLKPQHLLAEPPPRPRSVPPLASGSGLHEPGAELALVTADILKLTAGDVTVSFKKTKITKSGREDRFIGLKK